MNQFLDNTFLVIREILFIFSIFNGHYLFKNKTYLACVLRSNSLFVEATVIDDVTNIFKQLKNNFERHDAIDQSHLNLTSFLDYKENISPFFYHDNYLLCKKLIRAVSYLYKHVCKRNKKKEKIYRYLDILIL